MEITPWAVKQIFSYIKQVRYTQAYTSLKFNKHRQKNIFQYIYYNI